MAAARSPLAVLLAHALAKPGAWEDHPWGETVAKVGKKVFVCLGKPEGGGFSMSAKLPVDVLEGWIDESIARSRRRSSRRRRARANPRGPRARGPPPARRRRGASAAPPAKRRRSKESTRRR